MSTAYKKIAEGLKLMAEGYEALAGETPATDMPKAEPKRQSKKAAAPKEEKPAEAPVADKPAKDDEVSEHDQIFAEKDSYTVEDLRAALHYINQRGRLDECQKIFAEYGAKKVSQLPEDKYAEVMQKVRQLDA